MPKPKRETRLDLDLIPQAGEDLRGMTTPPSLLEARCEACGSKVGVVDDTPRKKCPVCGERRVRREG